MKIFVALLLLSTAAYAETQPPIQQAIGQKLMEEINANIQLRAQVLQLQAEIDKLKNPPKEEPTVEKPH